MFADTGRSRRKGSLGLEKENQQQGNEPIEKEGLGTSITSYITVHDGTAAEKKNIHHRAPVKSEETLELLLKHSHKVT